MLNPQIHRHIFLFGLIAMAVGMLFGTVPTSIPQFILFGNWLLEGRFKEKWQILKSNKIVWVLSSVFIIHLLGLLHTTDLARGIDDIRIKIPMQLLPLVFFTTQPISKKELKQLLELFVLATAVSLLWCVFYYYFHGVTDARKASRFMSHIRLGLYINLAISVLVYLIGEYDKLSSKIIAIATLLFLIVVMIILGLITGLVLFSILCFLYVLYVIFTRKLIYKVGGLSLLGVLIIAGLYLFKSEWNQFIHVDSSASNTKKELTESGRRYFPADTLNFHTENGFYITYNIQYDELIKEWSKRTKSNLFKEDKKGRILLWCAIRYLSSKGLTKDSVGVSQLTNEDISNIEKWVTNYKYADASPLRLRLKQFFWEYRDYKQGYNPSGNTMLMRLEFWQAAIYIIKRNLAFGVGAGDAQRAFNRAYYRTNTKLSHEWRLRSHNQFLAITVAFGITGLLVFLFSIIYPIIALRKQLNWLYWAFIVIALISFLTEDTLETQSGVSFFVYFNTLFLWLADSQKRNPGNQNL